MNNLILIKLGGSVITDKNLPYVAKPKEIRRLVKELKPFAKNIIIAHGSGSFGHTSATKYGGKKGYKSKVGIAKVARDASEINRIVIDIFINENIPVVSLRPMSMILARNGKMQKNFFQIIESVVKQGLIPVVYGDVIWDKEWKSTIFSGETTLSYVAKYLLKRGFKINKIIEVSDTNGVNDEKGKTIPEITINSWRQQKIYISKSKVSDVTGGMSHKIEEALEISKMKIETLIINGNIKNELKKALMNKKTGGTLIK